ncbi:hypothetical protein [Treponema sp. R6D11]
MRRFEDVSDNHDPLVGLLFPLPKFNFFLMVCSGEEFLKMFFRHPTRLPAQAKYSA